MSTKQQLYMVGRVPLCCLLWRTLRCGVAWAKAEAYPKVPLLRMSAQHFPKRYNCCILSQTGHLQLLIAFRNHGIPGAIVLWLLTNYLSLKSDCSYCTFSVSNCAFNLHSMLWMARTWSACLSLPCHHFMWPLFNCSLALPTCRWDHYKSNGTGGILHLLLHFIDHLYFGANKYLPRSAFKLDSSDTCSPSVIVNIFFERHLVFRETDSALKANCMLSIRSLTLLSLASFAGWEDWTVYLLTTMVHLLSFRDTL